MLRPLKVMFLVTSMHEFGGIERVTASVAGGLAERGHQVHLLTLRGQGSAFPLPPQVGLSSLGHSDGPLRLRGETPGLIRNIRRALLERRPDVLVVVDTFLSAFAFPAALGLPLRRVAWEHFTYHTRLGVRSRSVARRMAAGLAHDVVTLTERDAGHWREHLPRARARVQVIANPLPFERPAHNPYDASRRTVLAIGRLDHQKGFDLLLPAWAQVAPRHPDWSLRIIGRVMGQEGRTALLEQAAALGVPRWSLDEATAKVTDAFRASGLYCLSSRHEGLPMVLMESQAYGLPAVSFDCPNGPAELLATGGGLLVPPEDVNALARALNQLMADEAQRQRMSERAFEGARRYEASQILDQWEGLLSRPVQRRVRDAQPPQSRVI